MGQTRHDNSSRNNLNFLFRFFIQEFSIARGVNKWMLSLYDSLISSAVYFQCSISSDKASTDVLAKFSSKRWVLSFSLSFASCYSHINSTAPHITILLVLIRIRKTHSNMISLFQFIDWLEWAVLKLSAEIVAPRVCETHRLSFLGIWARNQASRYDWRTFRESLCTISLADARFWITDLRWPRFDRRQYRYGLEH